MCGVSFLKAIHTTKQAETVVEIAMIHIVLLPVVTVPTISFCIFFST